MYNQIDIPIPLKSRMALDCNSTSRVDFTDYFSSKTAEKSSKIL